jgi:hypothetical protein
MPTPVYEELTFPYEILLRFGNTETNRGKLTGGQLQKITQIYKDGQKFGPEVPGVPEHSLWLLVKTASCFRSCWVR